MDTTAGTINRIRIGAARMAHMDMDGGHTILFSLEAHLLLQRYRHRHPSLLNSEIATNSFFFAPNPCRTQDVSPSWVDFF